MTACAASRVAFVALQALAATGCATLGLDLALPGGQSATAGEPRHYEPDRRDYATFREAYPAVLDPNYLPFMVHRDAREGPGGDVLFFCRWDAEEMPLAVFVDTPEIPLALQDEFHPTEPRFFAAAVEHALRVWERELEGLVHFRLVESVEEARLRVRLRAERAPTPRPGAVVLGTTEALLSGCRVDGSDPDSSGLLVRFEVPELSIYVADEHGLLTRGQVERIAMHEIGHALGMLGHSPSPRDMMFAAYRERADVETLSPEDLNSFVSLYQLPNGTEYVALPPGEAPAAPPPWPPSGSPLLRPAPHVDPTRGFSLRLPEGWLVVESGRGVFAANGPGWDFDASLEIAVWPYATPAEFVERYGRALFTGDWLRSRAPATLAGRPGERLVFEAEHGGRVRDFRLHGIGDGRMLMVVAQAPLESERAWAAWFEAALATLELWNEGAE